MGVEVTKDGMTVSLLQGVTNVRGKDVPIRKSEVARVGDVYPDSALAEATIEAAKGDRDGLKYVDDPAEDSAPEPDANSEDGAEDYSDSKKWPLGKLEDEVLERDLDVQGTGQNGAIVRKDLVAALVADDKAS